MLGLLALACTFLLTLTVVVVGYGSIEGERRRVSAIVVEPEGRMPAGYCALCHAPLRRSATTAEVVFELEQQIDLETAAVARILARPGAESFHRLYQA